MFLKIKEVLKGDKYKEQNDELRSFMQPQDVMTRLSFAGVDYNEVRRARVQIIQENERIFTLGRYIVPPSASTNKKEKVVALDPQACRAGCLDLKVSVHDYITEEGADPATATPVETRPFFKTMTVEVAEKDCLLAAKEFTDKGLRPALLDMAEQDSPGGGYMDGCGAQEENLFRRSNCMLYLDYVSPGREWDYPIPDYGGFFVPGVTVIRGVEKEGYPLLEKPFVIDVICVAAMKNPRTRKSEKTGALKLREDAEELTLAKIRAIFRIAKENGVKEMVLCAFGCGAFGNPPGHVAILFRRVITEYWGFFSKIVFAIVDDHNSMKAHNEQGNVLPFATALSLGSYEEYLKADNTL